MNKKTLFLVKSALIAALYTVLTLLSAAFGLAYGGMQFRFSEALTLLPLFTSAAIPGLTVGCVVSNIFSSVTPLDTVIGSLATLLAAICTRKTRHITVKGIPVVSMLFPVIFNAVFIGAEIAFFSGEDVFFPVFITNALSVGAGELAVIATLGTALVIIFRKNHRLRELVSR